MLQAPNMSCDSCVLQVIGDTLGVLMGGVLLFWDYLTGENLGVCIINSGTSNICSHMIQILQSTPGQINGFMLLDPRLVLVARNTGIGSFIDVHRIEPSTDAGAPNIQDYAVRYQLPRLGPKARGSSLQMCTGPPSSPASPFRKATNSSPPLPNLSGKSHRCS